MAHTTYDHFASGFALLSLVCACKRSTVPALVVERLGLREPDPWLPKKPRGFPRVSDTKNKACLARPRCLYTEDPVKNMEQKKAKLYKRIAGVGSKRRLKTDETL